MDTRDIVEQLQDACDLATDKRELERLCGNAKEEIKRLRTDNAQLQYALEQSEAKYDTDAMAWAYGKCVALGLENGSMDSAMMMDRLKLMLGGYGA